VNDIDESAPHTLCYSSGRSSSCIVALRDQVNNGDDMIPRPAETNNGALHSMLLLMMTMMMMMMIMSTSSRMNCG